MLVAYLKGMLQTCISVPYSTSGESNYDMMSEFKEIKEETGIEREEICTNHFVFIKLENKKTVKQ